jgi:hypothetical protein
MILDNLLIFTGGTSYGVGTLPIGQAITATATSTNIIDLGPGPTNTALPPSQTTPNVQPIRDIGIGDDPAMKLLVMCLTTFTTGNGNFSVALQGAPDNGSGGAGSFTTYYTSPNYTIAGGTLNAGQRLMDMDMPRPPAGVAEPRFLQMNFTNSGTNFATATIFAAIVIDRHDQVYNATNNAILGGYPAGVVIAN